MHVLTKAISRLASELRDAEALRLRQTDAIKKAQARGKEIGLRRAISLLKRLRSEKLDDLVDLVRDNV